jgi:hypothetical protein
MRKRAQLKLGETIAVLVVFFILIMVGLVYYTDFRSKSIEEQRTEDKEMEAIEIANRMLMLPEVKCSEYQCIGCTDAIDLMKLDNMVYDNYGEQNKGFAYKNVKDYFEMFGYSTISLTLIYPDYTSIDPLTFSGSAYMTYNNANQPYSDISGDEYYRWTMYNQSESFSQRYNIPPDEVSYSTSFTPVNLYNPISDECYFGILEVAVFET